MSTLSNAKIKSEINAIVPDAIQVRRWIHQNPELSGSEFHTAGFISEKLKAIGLHPSMHLHKTAVSTEIRNGKGKTIVLRADTDALPVMENTNLPFSSSNKGVMHACGHDMHCAMLYGAASVLNKLKQKWSGTIIFLFQPSEEVEPGGALGLIQEGVFPKKTDAVFGLHVSTDHCCGSIGIKEGLDYAGITAFDITVKGKGGHGGTPEKTIDPVICAATIVTLLQTIISREKNSFIPAVLTIGSLVTGSLRNIIPEQAVIKGTLRCHSREMMEFLISRINDLATSTAAAFRATAECSFCRSYPPGFNNSHLTQLFLKRFSNYAGKNNVVLREFPTMYAEDFSYFQEKAPGLFIHLGVVQKGSKSEINGLHSAQFNPDESAIQTGIAAHVLFAIELLGSE